MSGCVHAGERETPSHFILFGRAQRLASDPAERNADLEQRGAVSGCAVWRRRAAVGGGGRGRRQAAGRRRREEAHRGQLEAGRHRRRRRRRVAQLPLRRGTRRSRVSGALNGALHGTLSTRH